MKKNAPLFQIADRHSLYMDLILVEFHNPILFTCTDEEDQMYIVTCFRADAQEKDWLIAETTPEKIVSLLNNTLTIRNAFPSGITSVYWAKMVRGASEPAITKYRADEIPEKFFPTPNMFMDGDEDEFKQELTDLRNRIAHQEETLTFCYSPQKTVTNLMLWISTYPSSAQNHLILQKGDTFHSIRQKQRRFSCEYV